jgi:hypothetical protein
VKGECKQSLIALRAFGFIILSSFLFYLAGGVSRQCA